MCSRLIRLDFTVSKRNDKQLVVEPLLIGGRTAEAAAVSPHVISRVVVHVSNANKAVKVAELTTEDSAKYVDDVKTEYSKIAKLYANRSCVKIRFLFCRFKVELLNLSGSW
ncbi:MAG: hypothetical protein ACKESB_02850 [Candidatus Hodgkinia cicadicola]